MDKSEKAQLLSLLMEDTTNDRRRQHLQDMEEYFSLIFSDSEESDLEPEEDDEYEFIRKATGTSGQSRNSNDIDSQVGMKGSSSVELSDVCGGKNSEPIVSPVERDFELVEVKECFKLSDIQSEHDVKLKIELCSDEEPNQDDKSQITLETSEACSDNDLPAYFENRKADDCFERNTFIETIDSYSDKEFKAHMRLERSTVMYLIAKYTDAEELRPYHGGRHRMGVKKELYAYLWYLGDSITFTELGNLVGVTKSSAWKAVCRVSWWLISISHEYVKWPQGAAVERSRKKFEQINKIPGVIGVIGCSHIFIKAPKDNRKHYYNKKQKYSLIIQAVVNCDKKFIDITCGEPGSFTNSQVLQRSDLYSRVLNSYEEMFPNESFLLCDSAYPATNWLVPPFMNNESLSDSQRRFNYVHAATKKVVDETFAMLKGRFRRLQQFTEQSNLCTVTNLIVSACILHNICVSRGDKFNVTVFEENEVEHVVEEACPNEYAIENTTPHRRKLLFDQLKNVKIV